MSKLFGLLTVLAITLATGCVSEDKNTGGSANNTDVQNINLRINNNQVTFNEGAYGETNTHALSFGLSHQTSKESQVTFELIEGSAIAGEHYVYDGSPRTITIPPMTQNFSIDIGLIGNDEYNEDRYFTLQFTEASGIYLPDAAKVQVNIKNNDPLPTIEFDSELVTVNQNIGTLSVLLKQDRTSALDSQVNLTFGGMASRGSRYEVGLEADNVVILAGEKESRFNIDITNDHIPRGNTNIVAQIVSTGNANSNQKNNSLTIIIQGQLGLPDTGVTHYYNNGNYNAKTPDIEHLYQDADYGRDVNHNPESFDGYASLSYTKLDVSGNPLPDSAPIFHCVRDNTTGLIWEHKMATSEGERVLPDTFSMEYVNRTFFRYVDDQYMWNNSNSSRNGGSAGGSSPQDLERLGDDGWGRTINKSLGGHCMLPGANHPYSVPTRNGCTTATYTQALNNSGACGFTDWRVPHISELSTLGVYDGPTERMDAKYILDPMPKAFRGPDETLRYWSSTPSADNESSAWCFELSTGSRMLCQKNAFFRLIAVRGGEQ